MSKELNYKVQAPEGGWGYIVAGTLSTICVLGVGHLSAFGILYENFLESLGNKLEGSTVANAIFLTFFNFIGLVANQLLKKHSTRYVGLVGAFSFVLGSILNVFVNSLIFFYISYGVLQGSGAGLMFHAMYRSFNNYFIVRRNVVLFVAQSVYAAMNIGIPYVIQYLMDTYGFRGTLAILCSINLHTIPAVLTLIPVKSHISKNDLLEKLSIHIEKIPNDNNEKLFEENNSPLIKDNLIKEIWKNIFNFLELSLLRDPVYVNIAFGLTLTTISDLMYLAVLPTYFQDLHYDGETVAYLMTLYMLTDFIGRVILVVISAFFTINNRYLVLFGAVTISIGRIVLTLMNSSFLLGIEICVIIIGLLRCLLELTIPLVLADYSQIRFNGALALYQIMCGTLVLLCGPLSKLIISFTVGNFWVVHVYTFFLLLSAALWSSEFAISYAYKNKH